MKRNFKTLLETIIIALAFAAAAQAGTKPLQLALVDPVQLVSAETSISGLRLNFLYGRNESVEGVDLGLVGLADSSFTGWQYNFLGNISKGDFSGLQMGFVNYAGNAKGLQLGVVNYAGSLKGLQIGLINIIDKGGVLPVMPFINWSF
ncbi:MAG: hypothetical protein ABII20_04680 [Candidatus Omnitrophota bacterium]|nr:hypothetical protein [Candidatus Omnitrophota bacterium]MBU2529115.1 hypothetical protein [bacterium]MBU3929462.1 hypothetical protein [bacterium]MBU4122841.1 hypothetical protein [bacterium]